MKSFQAFVFGLFSTLFLAASPSFSQETDFFKEPPLDRLSWEMGPKIVSIGQKASFQLPADFLYLGEEDTARFMKITGNPPAKGHYLIAPRHFHWFALFYFEETGYVKDDEKINADELLKSMKDSDQASNEERKRQGLKEVYVDGWAVLPHYDVTSKALEWGVRLLDEAGIKNANYMVRLLGRTGVMNALLVADLESLEGDVKDFKRQLTNFDFVAGERYAEFQKGDKVAEYGLAALVLGGAAAVATKKGFWGALAAFIAPLLKFFAAFWKLLVGALVVGIASLKSLFKRNHKE